MAPIPVTIITGFLGSGKTTLILNLIPQLPKSYKLALLKNEYGDVAIDSQLASEASISGVRELLNGCICCNLVGQLGDALFELRNEVAPDRIIIETSGSAFPATLAMEINRVARENPGTFVLDGVVSVIDVENWKGYEDTSVTAKMQAKFTDLIVFNKWELVDEMSFERCLDRVGDIDVQTAWVKSRKGVVDLGVIIGIDGALISQKQDALNEDPDGENSKTGHEHDHNGHGHAHYENHQDEVEVLSVILKGSEGAGIHLDDFEDLLLSAPKDEIYRIKGIIASTTPPPDSTGERKSNATTGIGIYILNWAFSRWTYTAMPSSTLSALDGSSAKLTFILARGESNKWKKKLEKGDLLHMEDRRQGELSVQKIG
ncbi:hypothetical protein LTS08_005955 [Lithohypha guttulata]|uniref:uncharacterized protein n=1 Tax=Lithohypha guttulata TaxID=1690604 RepID=UPI002DDF9226|nr:hypothetical protein LTR51_002469 [Lithohypha guttulata]KAK5099373.1 hypothetical protein LTS08_005955 [Lithohypha guttulata]